jgi:hypothetical protein
VTVRAPPLLWILCGVALGGCNFVANLGQFDGAEAVASLDGAPVADAGAAGDGPSGSEASAQADSSDSATDAGADAGDAGSWCRANSTTSTASCRDFDDGKQIAALWSIVYFTPSDFSSIDPTDHAPASAPNSLLFSTPAVAAGANAQGQLVDHLQFVSDVTLQFALKIPDFDLNASDVSLVRVAYQSGNWAVSLDYSGGVGNLLEAILPPDGGTQTTLLHPVSQPNLQMWTTVLLDVNINSQTVSLSYDGISVTNVPLSNPPNASTSAISVTVGANYLGGPAQPMHISYDNILINVR